MEKISSHKKGGHFFLQNSLNNFTKHSEQIGQNSAIIRYWGQFADLDNLSHQLDIFANLVGGGPYLQKMVGGGAIFAINPYKFNF